MITSIQNPLVKQIRKLHTPKGRREQGLFLLEGTHLLAEACAVSYPLETVCCTLEWQQRHPQLWEDVSKQAERSLFVSYNVLQALATTVNPDGIIATAKRSLFQQELKKIDLALALETIQDPGNLGTIIRTATAVGVSGLWMSSDCVDIDNPKVLRASAGAWFRLPMAITPDLKRLVLSYRQKGVQVVATLASAQEIYWDIDYHMPTLILLGNEGAGLSVDLLALCDKYVRIPLSAGVESLNVAIAAAIILYEARRQRQY